MKKRIILASGSPRRKELLEQLGISFEIIPGKKEEVITGKEPDKIVEELALQKAMEVAEYSPEAIVIGGDTIVFIDGEILGKPKDEQDARRMLMKLQGKTHQVYTGMAVIQNNKIEILFSEVTHVTFYPMSREEIDSYIKGKEPLDKAGAYGIQGKAAVFVKGIWGDYNNVVGLPLARFYQELKKRNMII